MKYQSITVKSRRPYLQEIAVGIDKLSRENEMNLNCDWVPRADNSEADFVSRCSDDDYWSVQKDIFEFLDPKWGRHTCDLFACDYKAKCSKFSSKYCCPRTSGIYAFAGLRKTSGRFHLLSIHKICLQKCSCTFIVLCGNHLHSGPLNLLKAFMILSNFRKVY